MSGRPRQATSVLLHLTGVAVGFVGQLRGLRKSIDAAGKANTLCGVLRSKRQLEALSNLRKIFELPCKGRCASLFCFFFPLFCA